MYQKQLFGVARKHATPAQKWGIKDGKGFLGEFGNIAKIGALSVITTGDIHRSKLFE